MRAKIQGDVILQIVVRADGTVEKARVVRSLDAAYGLDEQAIESVLGWRFTPARLGDREVPVAVLAVVNFRLH
jgi:TonB family protein